MNVCCLLVLLLSLQLVLLVSAQPTPTPPKDVFDQEQYSDNLNKEGLQICSVAGGLHVARLVSSNTRSLFRDLLADVESIREYVAEAAYNGGIVGDYYNEHEEDDDGPTKTSRLDALSHTLDWQARGLASDDTTVSAGLGYSDDRPHRRMERYVSSTSSMENKKETDLALLDSVSNIFPWLVDRRNREDRWYVSHQNGKSTQEHLASERLYVSAWIRTTQTQVHLRYPPLPRAFPNHTHPMGFGDIQDFLMQPNLSSNNDQLLSSVSAPYADTASPGRSLQTAQAPVHYTGSFQGQAYNQTFIAMTGIDISVDAMSSLLDELDDTLVDCSFAFLVNVAKGFSIVAISPSTVRRIYPQRTGMEDVRITYLPDGSVWHDRRNQTYTVSDTIHQSPLALSNANWTKLAESVGNTPPGKRSFIEMDIHLTVPNEKIPFYAMFERWPDVADYAFVVFAPKPKVDKAVNVDLEKMEMDLEITRGGPTPQIVDSVIFNNGTLDVVVKLQDHPSWMTLVTERRDEYKVKAGDSLTLEFQIDEAEIQGYTGAGLITYTISDDDYPECVFEQVVATKVTVKILYDVDMNQIEDMRIYGFVLAAIVILCAWACSAWVVLRRDHRVVRASQPLFLHVISAGISVMGLAIIFMGIDDSVASNKGCSMSCMAVPWLLSLGFSIVFSALFSKIWRVNQIVQACQKFQRVNVKAHHVLLPFAVIFTVNVLILILWTVFAPLVWVREFPEDPARDSDYNSYGVCSFQNDIVSKVLSLSLLAVNLSALLLALVQLFRARNVPTEYSEGRYIAIALGSNLQMFLTGLPILILVKDSPQLLYFVKASLVFLVAMSILLLIFLPKAFIMNNSSAPDLPSTPTVDESKTPSDKWANPKPNHNDVPSPGLPILSDITESLPPSEFESIASNDLTRSSYDIWRPKIEQIAKSNVKCPTRVPSIPEHEEFSENGWYGAGVDAKVSRSNAAMPSRHGASDDAESSRVNAAMRCRLASIIEDLSSAGESIHNNASKPQRVESFVEQNSEESTMRADVHSGNSFHNASKPLRVESLVEPIEEPTKGAEVCLGNSLRSNASKPLRVESLVEQTEADPSSDSEESILSEYYSELHSEEFSCSEESDDELCA